MKTFFRYLVATILIIGGIVLLYVAIATPEVIHAKNDPSNQLPIVIGVFGALTIITGLFVAAKRAKYAIELLGLGPF